MKSYAHIFVHKVIYAKVVTEADKQEMRLEMATRLIVLRSLKTFVKPNLRLKVMPIKTNSQNFFKICKIPKADRRRLRYYFSEREMKILDYVAAHNNMRAYALIRQLLFYHFAFPNPEETEQMFLNSFSDVFSEKDFTNSTPTPIFLDII